MVLALRVTAFHASLQEMQTFTGVAVSDFVSPLKRGMHSEVSESHPGEAFCVILPMKPAMKDKGHMEIQCVVSAGRGEAPIQI